MNDEDYVWYTDDNGKLRSVGYPIENMFKEANIPAIMGGRDIFLRGCRIPCYSCRTGLYEFVGFKRTG